MTTTARKTTARKAATVPTTAPVQEPTTDPTQERNDLLSVSFEGLEEETDPNPFAKGERKPYGERSRVPEDHPLYAPVRATHANQKAARLITAEPDELIRLLRKIADQQGLGVRIAVVTQEGDKLKPVPSRSNPDAGATVTTVSGRELRVDDLKGQTGKFGPITEGTKVVVRFMGTDKITRPNRKAN